MILDYFLNLLALFSFCLLVDEESITDRADIEEGVEILTDEVDIESTKSSELPNSGEIGTLMKVKKEDGKLRSLSNRVVYCQGKSLRIHVPLTNPTRTFSAVSYVLWDDLVNQTSKKCGTEKKKLHINKTKLRHAEKMIRGAFIELYKGLGYLKTYWYVNSCVLLAFFYANEGKCIDLSILTGT